jgi:Replication initiation factor
MAKTSRLLSIGVDWLTVTQIHGPEADLIRATALGLADVELHAGMYGRPWRANGYEGFTVGHLDYGERDSDVICRIHGPIAHAHWRRLFELGRNVSRIDLEVTVRTNEDPAFIVRRHLREFQRHKKKLKRGPQVEYKVSDNGGMTVYSGSPASARRLRIYDKQRESEQKQFEGGVRYEAQFNGKKGLWAASAIHAIDAPARRIASMVFGFAAERGGKVRSLLESFCCGADVSTPQPWPAETSDADRTLQWLSKSVAPSVQRVVQLKGMVAVLQSLGLAET